MANHSPAGPIHRPLAHGGHEGLLGAAAILEHVARSQARSGPVHEPSAGVATVRIVEVVVVHHDPEPEA